MLPDSKNVIVLFTYLLAIVIIVKIHFVVSYEFVLERFPYLGFDFVFLLFPHGNRL